MFERVVTRTSFSDLHVERISVVSLDIVAGLDRRWKMAPSSRVAVVSDPASTIDHAFVSISPSFTSLSSACWIMYDIKSFLGVVDAMRSITRLRRTGNFAIVSRIGTLKRRALGPWRGQGSTALQTSSHEFKGGENVGNPGMVCGVFQAGEIVTNAKNPCKMKRIQISLGQHREEIGLRVCGLYGECTEGRINVPIASTKSNRTMERGRPLVQPSSFNLSTSISTISCVRYSCSSSALLENAGPR